jgi:hypothetical protein
MKFSKSSGFSPVEELDFSGPFDKKSSKTNNSKIDETISRRDKFVADLNAKNRMFFI